MRGTGKGWIEKRKFQRVEVALNASFVAVDESYGIQMKGESAYKETALPQVSQTYLRTPMMLAITHDISEGGLSLVTDKPLPVGSYLVVDIHLPSVGESLRALAMVMRLEDAGGSLDATSATRRMGLQLIAIHKEGLERLQGLVLRRLHGRMAKAA